MAGKRATRTIVSYWPTRLSKPSWNSVTAPLVIVRQAGLYSRRCHQARARASRHRPCGAIRSPISQIGTQFRKVLFGIFWRIWWILLRTMLGSLKFFATLFSADRGDND